MKDNADQFLETLFTAARDVQPETSRVEFGFETRLGARLREEARGSLAMWAWKLCPFFAALALAAGWWNYTSAPGDNDAQILSDAACASDDQALLVYMTGERR